MNQKIEKWAKIMVNYSCNVQKGEWVYLVTNSMEAKLLYDAVRREILRKGAHVSDHFIYDPCGCTRVGLEHDHLFLGQASEEQLDCFPGFKMSEVEAMHCLIVIEVNFDPRSTQNIPHWKYTRRMKTLNPLMDVRFTKRWVLTNCPAEALAKKSGMPLRELRKFVYATLFLNKEDPVAEWQKVSRSQAKLIDFLKDAEAVRIKGNQSDLIINVAGRIWENCDGHLNLPDGEVFTGPIEDSAEGVIYFGDFPVVSGGQEVSGIKLRFLAGKVIEASAQKGNEYLQAILNTDNGSSYLGELGIGTNFGIRNQTQDILFDEKIGGTMHLAVGDGYPLTGSKNKSAIHQDMIKPLKIFNQNDPDQAELLVQKGGQWFRLARKGEELTFC